MTDVNTLRRYFERALALAHAAVDEPTPDRIADAQAIGAEVLLLAARGRPAAATLTDGHVLYAHASRLRALLALLDEYALPSASTYNSESGARASLR